jgi:AcrR family transcriptional regulator
MNPSNSQLNRDSWLALALEILAQEGRAKIKIEYLAEKLGVTRGSFYAHFSDRRDFDKSIAVYWAETLTSKSLASFRQSKGSAQERLLVLIQRIKDDDLPKYDIVMRAWALDEPLVAEQVERVDRERYEYIKSLFAEMGFTGNDLEMRTMIFQAYHSVSPALFGSIFEENRFKNEKIRHQFFIQKIDEDIKPY